MIRGWMALVLMGILAGCGGGGGNPGQAPPVITRQPVDATATEGQEATFSAGVSGAASLQWQTSADGAAWADLPGAAGETLTVTAGAGDDGRRYRLEARNSGGSVTSGSARLTVLPSTMVQTEYGRVQGAAFPGGTEFLGIPYAKPPVGPLRWKAPLPPDPWPGVLATQAFRPPCPQLNFAPGATEGDPVGDEDCLYLNVWTPALARPALPVLVFLHGGGHQQGSPGEVAQGTQLYLGRRMAAGGQAIVVTPAFRVGPLGYLAHAGLDAEDGVSGNFGVRDQILALGWVQRNIGRFGGDPTRVMVFGESAGGVDAGNLLVAPQAEGLFQRVGIHSAFPMLDTYEAGLAQGKAWADTLAPGGTDAEQIAALRALDWQTLVSTETNVVSGGIVNQVWQPVQDGAVFPRMPLEAFATGDFNQVPVLLGSNADEMSLTAPATVTPAQVNLLLALMVPSERLAEARLLYPPGATNEEARASYIQILTDAQFTAGVRRTARALAAWPGSPVWRYFFTHTQSAGYASLGAYHGIELFYVFNTLQDTTYAGLGLRTPGDQAVEDAMLRHWVAFAMNGTPEVAGLAPWPALQGDLDRYMELKAVPDGSQSGVRTGKCDFWDSLGR